MCFFTIHEKYFKKKRCEQGLTYNNATHVSIDAMYVKKCRVSLKNEFTGTFLSEGQTKSLRTKTRLKRLHGFCFPVVRLTSLQSFA